MRDAQLVAAFEHWIAASPYPCVGAKSTLSRGNITYFFADGIHRDTRDRALLKALYAFRERWQECDTFVSFVVIFREPGPGTEELFEEALWQRLDHLHHLDYPAFDWDDRVNADPRSPEFSMSLGGQAYYIIGLHEASSRRARRFIRPALVFNLHEQFEVLRREERYERMRQAIVQRDIAYSGSPNPMLARHGEISEASQYSGRAVGPEWKCPFAPQPHANQDGKQT